MEAFSDFVYWGLVVYAVIGAYNRLVLHVKEDEDLLEIVTEIIKVPPKVAFVGCATPLIVLAVYLFALALALFLSWWLPTIVTVTIFVAPILFFFWKDVPQALHYFFVSYPEGGIYEDLLATDFKDLNKAEALGKAIQEAVTEMSLNPGPRHMSWKIQNRTKKLDGIKASLKKVNLRREKKEEKERVKLEIKLHKERERVNPSPTAEDVERSKEIQDFSDTSSEVIDDLINTIRKKQ